MSQTSFMLLYFIRIEKEEKTQSEIADDFFYSRQTINFAISILVKNGFVDLIMRNDRGHYKLIHLTESGIDFCEKWIDPIIEADNKCYLSLSIEEQKEYLRLYQTQLNTFKKNK